MLNLLKKEAQMTRTENGALTYATAQSECLDLFSTIGALRNADDKTIENRFVRAYAEDPDLSMKIAFFARDIRGGLGERRVFRVILRYLARKEPETVRKNIKNIAEYGRYDDLLVLMDTQCRDVMLQVLSEQLKKDIVAMENGSAEVSLLGKWLPSINASNAKTVQTAKKLARAFRMRDAEYRKMLSRLRARIAIIENNLRTRDYTFDYSKQPSRAMFKYRRAFLRNDAERYERYIQRVKAGKEKMNAGTLYPYELIAQCLSNQTDEKERAVLDATWKALPDYTTGEDALVVVDGSGSMHWNVQPSPISVALSLGLYFAERNKGAFKNHFITFSHSPRLVEIKGKDLSARVRYCASYNECANTNLQAVFDLVLRTAVKHRLKQSELPATLYIISDMEFDSCAENADVTNFEKAKQKYRQNGYRLPNVVFWNVASRAGQQPVTKNEQGVALVSGCSPRLFQMVISGQTSPYQCMLEILNSERYAGIAA